MSSVTDHRRFAPRWSSGGLAAGALTAAALAGSLALLASHGALVPSRVGAREIDLLGVALAACSTLPLIAWRRSPLVVFGVTAASSVLLAGLGYAVDLMLGPTAALYLLAASRDRDEPWKSRTTAVVVGLFVAYLGATALAQRAFPGLELLHTGLAWAVAWFAGERTRLRREQIAELKERAARAERETERERLLGVAEERTRIARDLHDSAGHAISVIAVRAGAARMRHDEDPGRSRRALEAIEALARETVEEIDEIVGTLRDGRFRNGAVDAPPGLASLETLVAQHTAAGLDVSVDTAGTLRPLGGASDQAAYRIIQEALTNAARHGAGSARIELTFGDTALDVAVTNPVLAGDGGARSSGGHGVIGMRERAELVGGSLDIDRADDGFRVRAVIPYGAHRA